MWRMITWPPWYSPPRKRLKIQGGQWRPVKTWEILTGFPTESSHQIRDTCWTLITNALELLCHHTFSSTSFALDICLRNYQHAVLCMPSVKCLQLQASPQKKKESNKRVSGVNRCTTIAGGSRPSFSSTCKFWFGFRMWILKLRQWSPSLAPTDTGWACRLECNNLSRIGQAVRWDQWTDALGAIVVAPATTCWLWQSHGPMTCTHPPARIGPACICLSVSLRLQLHSTG